jgi:transcriptional antiterminator RfaH
VDRILTRAGTPEPIPQGLVEQLLSAASRLHLEEGQTVRVTAGPFADLLGRLATLDDSGRVRVLLNLLGGEVPVVLPEGLIMPGSVAP